MDIMKILQLNVWMGKVEGGLKRFLLNHDFDVICMQEVFATQSREQHLSRLCFDLSQIVEASGLRHVFFSPNWSFDMVGGGCMLGNVILSRTPFIKTHSEFINGEYRENIMLGAMPANNLNIQIVQLENGFTIVNHHGFWRPDPMGDDETIKAFTKVGQVVKKLQGPVVMCGDLNVVHESPAMRSLDFLRDLTHENHIKTTLSGLKYDGAVPCDHILVNDAVRVKDFTVYPDLASDHLALSAEVELI